MREPYDFYYCNQKKLARNIGRQQRRMRKEFLLNEMKNAFPLWEAALGQRLPRPSFWQRIKRFFTLLRGAKR